MNDLVFLAMLGELHLPFSPTSHKREAEQTEVYALCIFILLTLGTCPLYKAARYEEKPF